jgi:hypothetical protein
VLAVAVAVANGGRLGLKRVEATNDESFTRWHTSPSSFFQALALLFGQQTPP